MKFTTIANARKQVGVSYLGGINTSAKIMKNGKVNHQYTYIIYLSPASTSGYNVCMYSTPECRLGCLATSGRAAMDITSGHNIISKARIAKTKLFHENTEFFMQWMIAEMQMFQRKAVKNGYGFSARLNGTSDIDWANVKINELNIFEIFPDVQFYDYTKDVNKLFNPISNYHLTFSYAGYKDEMYTKVLAKGINIATVFNVKKGQPLPSTFLGYAVIDGDLTDYRKEDGQGVVVGLRFKKIQDKVSQEKILNSVFVVQPTDQRCNVQVDNLTVVR